MTNLIISVFCIYIFSIFALFALKLIYSFTGNKMPSDLNNGFGTYIPAYNTLAAIVGIVFVVGSLAKWIPRHDVNAEIDSFLN